MAIAVNEVRRQAQPLKDAGLKGGVLVKIEKPAAQWEFSLLADWWPVAVGEKPADSEGGRSVSYTLSADLAIHCWLDLDSGSTGSE